MAIPLINQITERVFKGDPGGIDALAFTALSLVNVGYSASEADFTLGVDYQLTSGGVDWSLPGKQPATGVAYYATYTFQGDSSFKDFVTVRTEMQTNLGALQPLASTQDGSVTMNLFCDLPSTSLANLYSSIQRVADIYSLSNVDEFQGTELADYGANFNLTPGGPTFSTGFATFSAPQITTIPIVVPLGEVVSTLSTTAQTSLGFITTESGTIYPGQSSVTIPIQAQVAGAAGNVGPGTITLLGSTITGVSTVYNQNATTGGTDSESAADFAARIQATFLANDAVTFRGIRRLALTLPNVIDALVVGAGDPLLTRAEGAGGYVDLYIQAEANIGLTQVDTITVPTLVGTPMVLSLQPVLSITSVYDTTTSVTLPPTQYLLAKDVSDVSESTSSTDSLVVISGVSGGDVLTVTYQYNGVLQNALDFFMNQNMNAVPARNLLPRSAIEVFIDVTDTITLVPGADPVATVAQIQSNIAEYIGGLTLGATIKYSTSFDLIDSVAGVNDTEPLALLAIRGQATASTIVLGRDQYPLAGDITIYIAS
jgi:uncharacterized phage protein gp47/JayE